MSSPNIILSDIALVHQQCKVQHQVKLRCIIYVLKQLYFLLHWKSANRADVQVKYKYNKVTYQPQLLAVIGIFTLSKLLQ